MLRKYFNHYGENEYHPKSFEKIYKVLELNNKKSHSTSKKKLCEKRNENCQRQKLMRRHYFQII